MTIEEILAGESKNIEFKVERPKDSKKYTKSVVAFANGHGGKIIFGIEDETLNVVGIPDDVVFQEIDAITNAISDSCEPTIVPDITLQTIDDKTIIIVEISAGRQRPYYIKAQGIFNGTYIRVSGTSRPAGGDQVKEMFYESEGRSYDRVPRRDMQVFEEDVEKLCQSMKEVALANCKNDTQRLAVKNVTKNVLISWGVLEEVDGKLYPTNAYVYLLGLDSFLSRIQCGVFKGTTRAIFVDRREYGGTLWQQIDEAYQFVLRNIHLGARIEGIYRKDIYELPPDSIRELIINAVVHCSFLQSSLIQVAIYDDRLEITSPGGLMPGVTLEKMKEGYSKIRNHAIASAFSYMNIIEQWGSGIPKIIREVSEYGLREPEFIDMECALRINIYRKQVEENVFEDGLKTGRPDMIDPKSDLIDPKTDLVDPKMDVIDPKSDSIDPEADLINPKSDSDNFTTGIQESIEEKLLEIIRQNPETTRKILSEKLGVSDTTVKRILAKLQEKGNLYREGSRRKGRWLINEKK